MLKQPVRPRAPSSATLKILYQLAYITSGTALGLGTLCAEERRRRIQVVQKIADNAKRLRQHPRYRHNVASATARAGDDGHQHEMLRHESREDRCQEGAVLGPELPSVIDRAYTYTSERASNASKVKRHNDKEWNDHTISAYNPATWLSPLTTDTSTPLQEQPQRPTRVAPATLSASSKTIKRTGIRRSISEVDAALGVTQQDKRQTRKPYSQFKSRYYWIKSETPRFWETLRSADREAVEARLSSDVAKLFHLSGTKSEETRLNKGTARKISLALMGLAAGVGQLRDATSLLLWRLAVGRVTYTDLRLLAQTYNNFKVGGKSWEVGIIRPPSVTGQSSLGTATDVPVEDNNTLFQAGAHQPIVAALNSESDLKWLRSNSQMRSSILECCRTLRKLGYLGAAVYTLTALPIREWASDSIKQLVQDLFCVATRRSQPELSYRILEWTGGRLLNEYISKADINTFIEVCGRTKAYTLLSAIFKDPHGPNALLLQDQEVLSASSFLQLCYAFADGPKPLRVSLDKCYKQLPEELRDVFRSRHLDWLAAKLTWSWTTTYDLQAVLQQYDRVIHRTLDRKDQYAARSLHLAMIRICLAAGNVQRAKDITATLQDAGYDINSSLAMMLAYAHSHDWNALEAVLDIPAKNAVSGEVQFSTIRHILKLYTRDHDASEVLKLCVRMLEALQLAPSSLISVFILQEAVAEQRHDVFHSWFKTCNRHRWKVDVTAELAASLLRKHAVTVRPHHAMVMGTSHEITSRAPGLYSDEMKDVVKEAIAYDIRSHRHRRADWKIAHAEQRLRHVLRSSDYVPHPGTKYDQKLTLTLRHDQHSRLRPEKISDEDRTPQKDQHSRPHRVYDPASSTSAHIPSRDTFQNSDQCGVESALLWSHDPSHAFEHAKDDVAGLDGDSADAFSVSTSAEVNTWTKRSTRTQMLLALTSHEYKKVLRLYRKSCDVNGLPKSAVTLEIALDASLRMHKGDPTYARAILSAAQAAGMNTAIAMGPVLLHRVMSRSGFTESEASSIKTDVMNYYRVNEQNGRQVTHHLAVTAANKLTKEGLAKHGAAILEEVFRSDWAHLKALDAVGITVWIKAYVFLRNITGVCELVNHILATAVRIDSSLIWTLKMAERSPWLLFNRAMRSFTDREQEMVRHCHYLCRQRRQAQREKVSWYLPKLAHSLVKLWRHATYGPPPTTRRTSVRLPVQQKTDAFGTLRV